MDIAKQDKEFLKMAYHIFIDNGIIQGCGEAKLVGENVINYEVDEKFYQEFQQNPDKYIWDGLQVVENPNYEQEQAQKEHERIQELFMTRSDFFDGTILAWGVGQKELLVLIETLLATLPMEDVKKLVAINNFENALNFYRKHDLFKMLTNIPIPLTETLQVTITDEQWDRFFDETDKDNKEAYKELPAPELIPVEEPEVPVEPEEPIETIPESDVDNSEEQETKEPVIDNVTDTEDVNNLDEVM